MADPARGEKWSVLSLSEGFHRARRDVLIPTSTPAAIEAPRGCRLGSVCLQETAMKPTEVRPIARNRKARHVYEILETYEAGLVLKGTEVKSLRAGKASLGEAYVRVRNDEAWLENCHIPPYDHGGHENHEPLAPRKLLLGKREIRKLAAAVQQKGLTIVPLQLYFRGAWVKVEIAVARGKKLHDKRESLKKTQAKREIDRARRSR